MRRAGPKLLATLGVLALALVVLLSLGTWQVYRYYDAEATEDRFEERIADPPVQWSDTEAPAAEAVDFRRVQVTGTWDNEQTQFLTARMRYGILGEEIVTPLIPDQGGPAVLVNRGWYPVAVREAVVPEMLAEERASVEGLGREAATDTASRTPDGHWAWLDVYGIGRELAYPVVPWFLIQGTRATGEESQNPEQGLPVQVYSGFTSDTPHVEYAATWYGLALTLIAVAAIRLWQRGSSDPSLAIPPFPGPPQSGPQRGPAGRSDS